MAFKLTSPLKHVSLFLKINLVYLIGSVSPETPTLLGQGEAAKPFQVSATQGGWWSLL